jgi:hypothetical protein
VRRRSNIRSDLSASSSLTRPGAASDIVARLVAAAMAEKLGQSLFVDNRGGGAGIIGTQAIATAAPDGYTIGVVDSALTINPSLLCFNCHNSSPNSCRSWTPSRSRRLAVSYFGEITDTAARVVPFPWITPRGGLDYLRATVKRIIRAAGLRDELSFTEGADSDLSDAELRAAGRHRSAGQLPTYAKRTRKQLVTGAQKRRAERTKPAVLPE